MSDATDRSTKRQRELLLHVDAFIKEHGYGPSYREIMTALGYKSVSTVAIHIDNLIAKGYLHKRDHSARSLEVVSSNYTGKDLSANTGGNKAQEKLLVDAVKERFDLYRHRPSPQLLDELYVLIGALKVLGFDGAYEAMRARLAEATRR